MRDTEGRSGDYLIMTKKKQTKKTAQLQSLTYYQKRDKK